MGVPINAAIPLSARPIAPESPMQAAGQVLSIRDAMQRGQIQAQQLQQFQMENQQRAQDLADQQKFMNAWRQAKGDLDQTLSLATDAGVQPKIIMAFKNMVVDQKTKMATLGGKELDNHIKQLQQVGGQAQSLLDMADENTRAAAWQSVRQNAINNGFATEAEVPVSYPGKDWLQERAYSGMSQLQMAQAVAAQKNAAAAATRAKSMADRATLEQQKWDVEKPAAQAKATKEQLTDAANQLSATKLDPEDYASRLAKLPRDLQNALPSAEDYAADPSAGQKVIASIAMTAAQRSEAEARSATERHQKVAESQRATELNLKRAEVDPFGMFGTGGVPSSGAAPQSGATAPASGAITPEMHGEDFLSKLPETVANQVKALSDGRLAFPAGFALKSPYWQKMLSMVGQYDPSFDAVNFNARSKTRAAFTSGAEAKQVNALNTVIGHMDSLSNATEKLTNTSWQPVNTLKNFLAEKTGDPDITNFKAIRNSVADELVRVWRQAGGSEADIQARLKDLDTSKSPQQLHGVLAATTDLLKSKIESLESQYKQGMGTTAQGIALITPKSQQVVDKLRAKAGVGPTETQTPATSATENQPPPLPPALSASDVGKIYTRFGKKIKITAVNPSNPKQFQSTEVQD